MRTPVLFALALAGTVAATTDVSAFGHRRRSAAASEGCSGGGYVAPTYGGCYGSGYGTSASGGCYGSYGTYAAGSYASGGCYGSGYSSQASGGCSGSAYAQSGYAHSAYAQSVSGYGSVAYGRPAWSGYSVAYSRPTYAMPSWGSVAVTGGQATMIRATDGTYYTLGADGTYYAAGANGVSTVGATTSGYSPSASDGTGVIQASGTAPLTTGTSIFRAKQILGTQILVQGDSRVGTVEDMVTDAAGNLDYLIVSTGDNKLVTVPWDAAKFDAEKKTAMVNVTPEVWRAVPKYTTTTYPLFYTPTYRTDIFRAYGLTPRELRRGR